MLSRWWWENFSKNSVLVQSCGSDRPCVTMWSSAKQRESPREGERPQRAPYCRQTGRTRWTDETKRQTMLHLSRKRPQGTPGTSGRPESPTPTSSFLHSFMIILETSSTITCQLLTYWKVHGIVVIITCWTSKASQNSTMVQWQGSNWSCQGSRLQGCHVQFDHQGMSWLWGPHWFQICMAQTWQADCLGTRHIEDHMQQGWRAMPFIIRYDHFVLFKLYS